MRDELDKGPAVREDALGSAIGSAVLAVIGLAISPFTVFSLSGLALVLFGPPAVYLAIRAKRISRGNPKMIANVVATAGLAIGILDCAALAFWIIAIIVGAVSG